MPQYTREGLLRRLREINAMGYVESTRPGNQGGVGNTLEDLLGIEENNLPTRDAGEFEIKSQRMEGGGLTTLLHREPEPRRARVVPRMLLPLYGWPHEEAGVKYPKSEMSFRQTINGRTRTGRGFGLELDRRSGRLCVSFDARAVDAAHRGWLESVRERAGTGELDPQPYWGLDDLARTLGTKLGNCIYVHAANMRRAGVESFHYKSFYVLEGFNFGRFIDGVRDGFVYVDFDARSGHNHGTKLRLRHDSIQRLYDRGITIEQ